MSYFGFWVDHLILDHVFYSTFQKVFCFLLTSDGKLKMSRCDSLHLEILWSVSCQLENLSSEIFQDSRTVDSSSGANTSSGETARLQVTMDSENILKLLAKIFCLYFYQKIFWSLELLVLGAIYRVFVNEGQTESGSNLVIFWPEILPKAF